jgi:hypothetical protein
MMMFFMIKSPSLGCSESRRSIASAVPDQEYARV